MEDQNHPQPVQPSNMPGNGLEIDTRVFAGLSYLSILFVVPWVAKKEDKFVMFHVRQGATLFIAELVATVILWLLEKFLTSIFSFGALTVTSVLSKLVWIFFAIVSIIGVYFAVKGMEKKMPILSLFSRNLKI